MFKVIKLEVDYSVLNVECSISGLRPPFLNHEVHEDHEDN